MVEQLLRTNNQLKNITFLESDSNDNLSWTTRTLQKFIIFCIGFTLSGHFTFLSHSLFSTERTATCEQISKTTKLLPYSLLWKKTNKPCQNPPKPTTKSPKQNNTTNKKQNQPTTTKRTQQQQKNPNNNKKPQSNKTQG